MKKYVRYIDILSNDVNINIEGNKGVGTVFGAILSLVYMGITIWMVCLICFEYFSTDKPKVRMDVADSETYPLVSLVQNAHLPILSAYVEDSFAILGEDFDRYFTAIMYKYTYTRFTDDQNNTNFRVDVSSNKFVPCSQLTPVQYERYTRYLSITPITRMINITGLCADIEEDDISIFGQPSDTKKVEVSIRIMPCSLTNNTCITDMGVLRKVGILYIESDKNVNLSNHNNPVKFSAKTDYFFKINPSAVQHYQKKVQMNSIWDDNGFLFGEKLRLSFTSVQSTHPTFEYRDSFSIQCTPNSVGTDACQAYLRLDVMSGGRQERYMREYKGLIETLGEIGGIKELLFTVLSYIYYAYNTREMKRKLVKSVYNIERGKENRRKKRDDDRSGACVENRIVRGEDGRGEVDGDTHDSIYKDIENSMDIVNIIKMMNEVRFISYILFSESDAKRIPDICLLNDLSTHALHSSNEIVRYTIREDDIHNNKDNSGMKVVLDKQKYINTNRIWSKPVKIKRSEIHQVPSRLNMTDKHESNKILDDDDSIKREGNSIGLQKDQDDMLSDINKSIRKVVDQMYHNRNNSEQPSILKYNI